MPPPTTFGALIAFALRLCARRWWLYLVAAIVTIGLETALLAIKGLHDPITIAATLLPPILVLIVYVFVATDATGEEASLGARWERILERSWAVILIQIVQGAILGVTIYGLNGQDLQSFLLGLTCYALLMFTIYADINAALEPKVRTLWLIPNAFWRSFALATNRLTMYLTLALVATEVLLAILPLALEQWLAYLHVADASYWVSIALQTALQVPISALAVVVYLECLSREKAASSER